jgi:hypothetical protein
MVEEFVNGYPPKLRVKEGGQPPCLDFGDKYQQSDLAIAIAVARSSQKGAHPGMYVEFFDQFPFQAGPGALAGIDFPTGKFPFPFQWIAGRSLSN